MKQIEPVQIWINGITKAAEFLEVREINVFNGNDAEFIWSLFTKEVDAEGKEFPSELIVTGDLKMNGSDYQESQDDSFAPQWVASQLNLVIL
jgi:hypothetical protein